MELNLSDTGKIIAPLGNEIDINVRITGSQPLTFTGGGTFKLTPSGVSTTNLFTGKIIIADGIVIAGNPPVGIVGVVAGIVGVGAAEVGVLGDTAPPPKGETPKLLYKVE